MSLKAKIEAVIYASEEPVTLAQLVGLLGEEAQAELDRIVEAQQTLALDEVDDAAPEAATVPGGDADEVSEAVVAVESDAAAVALRHHIPRLFLTRTLAPRIRAMKNAIAAPMSARTQVTTVHERCSPAIRAKKFIDAKSVALAAIQANASGALFERGAGETGGAEALAAAASVVAARISPFTVRASSPRQASSRGETKMKAWHGLGGRRGG